MANTYTTTTLPNNYTISASSATGSSISWSNSVNGTYSINQPYESVMTYKDNPPSLEVKGKMIINGLDLEERLKTIEKVLAIPERDVTMEAKYPSLKKKFDDYINTLEKYKTFERIKGTHD
jgi:hypothetical protein